MDYVELNAQQQYVLGRSYEGLNQPFRRWKPEQVLGQAHACCDQCQHRLIAGDLRASFEQALVRARESNSFSDVFACWNYDRDIVALLGIIGATNRFVLIGEYALRGTLPSYQERLANLQSMYRACWPGHLVVAALLIVGIYGAVLFVPALLFHEHDGQANPHAMFIFFLALAIPIGQASFKRYLLLFRKQATEPSALAHQS